MAPMHAFTGVLRTASSRRLVAVSAFALALLLVAMPLVALGATPTVVDNTLNADGYETGFGIADGKIFYISTDNRICMIDLSDGSDAGCGADLWALDLEAVGIATLNDEVYVMLDDVNSTTDGTIRSVDSDTASLGAVRYSFDGDTAPYAFTTNGGAYGANLIASDGQLFAWTRLNNNFNDGGYLRFTQTGAALTVGSFNSDVTTNSPVDVAVGGNRVLTGAAGYMNLFNMTGTKQLQINPLGAGAQYLGFSYDADGGNFYAVGVVGGAGHVLRIDPSSGSVNDLGLPSEVSQYATDSRAIGDSLYVFVGDAVVRMDLSTEIFTVEMLDPRYSAEARTDYDPTASTLWLNVWDNEAAATFVGYDIADLGGDAGSTPTPTPTPSGDSGNDGGVQPWPALPDTGRWDESVTIQPNSSAPVSEDDMVWHFDDNLASPANATSMSLAVSPGQSVGVHGLWRLDGHGTTLDLCFDTDECLDTVSLGDINGATIYNIDWTAFALSATAPEDATEAYLVWSVGSEAEIDGLTWFFSANDTSITRVDVTPTITVTAPALLDFGPGIPGDILTVNDIVNVKTNFGAGYTLTSDWTGLVGMTSLDTINESALTFTLDGTASTGALERTMEVGTDHDLAGSITVPFVDTDTYNGSITFTGTTN